MKESQLQKMAKEPWRTLIIFDACRYDFFEKVHKDFLDGRLEFIISPSTHTLGWCKAIFGKMRCHDVIYISANPFINSKVEVAGFYAKKHFHKVIDVWRWGWNSQLGSVHPWEVTKASLVIRKIHTDKRYIIHYLQPHYPYLRIGRVYEQMDFEGIRLKDEKDTNTLTTCLLSVIGDIIERLLGHEKRAQIREMLKLPPINEVEAVKSRSRQKTRCKGLNFG